MKNTRKAEKRNRKEKKVRRRNQGSQGEESRWLARGGITRIRFIKAGEREREGDRKRERERDGGRGERERSCNTELRALLEFNRKEILV